MSDSKTVSTFYKDINLELQMERDHVIEWSSIVNSVSPSLIRDLSILDYGCNRGGFLRYLNQCFPVSSGLGVDVAVDSLEYAKQQVHSEENLRYEHVDALLNNSNQCRFDVAFSNEVVYCISDLNAHANLIKSTLKPESGIYYCCISAVINNPDWQNWKRSFDKDLQVPVFEHSLDSIMTALHTNGFQVSARRLCIDEFVPARGAYNDAIQGMEQLLITLYERKWLIKAELC